jgi:hypothetical protein
MDPRSIYDSAGSHNRMWQALERAGRFQMGNDAPQLAMRKLVRILDEAEIPYAVAGALALNQHGYQRFTVDLDLLLTPAGLEALKSRVLGLGYVERFAGSKGMRDTENNVAIDVLLTGDFPGDGKPKAVAFPDPIEGGTEIEGIRFLKLGKLIEMKLASGMSARHRMKDLTDVLELIRAVKLPREFGRELDASVRGKYDELWLDAASAPPNEDY